MCQAVPLQQHNDMDRKAARAKDTKNTEQNAAQVFAREEALVAENARKKYIVELSSSIVEGIAYILKQQLSGQITKQDISQIVGEIKPPTVNIPPTVIPPAEVKIDLTPIEHLLIDVLTELRKPEEEKEFVLKLV